MKVALFIADLSAGGAERVVSILANTWVDYPDVEVSVVMLFDTQPFYQLDRRVRIVGLGMTPGAPPMHRSRDLLAAGRRLRQWARDERPAFVLSFMNKYNVFCLAATVGLGVPVIVSERDSPTEEGRDFNWFMRKVFYPQAAGVITQSKLSCDVLMSRVACRDVVVIPNPVVALCGEPWQLGRNVILSVGRLVAKKGQGDLLQAFARMRANEWRLVICGDGPLRKDLEARAMALELGGRVEFVGTVRNVGDWHQKAGLFAFPSHWEGYPNALAEAMLSGLPCVSYDCPTGPSDIIENERNGILVPTGDVDRLAQALQRLVDNPALAARMGQEARKLVEVVSPRAVCRAYLDYCKVRAFIPQSGDATLAYNT